jgi:hypothetical protein
MIGFIIFCVFFLGNSKAQNSFSVENLSFDQQNNELKQIPKRIADLKSAGMSFVRQELFLPSVDKVSENDQLQEVLTDGVILDLNKPAIRDLLKEDIEFLTLPLPDGKGGVLELELEKVNIFAPGFSVKPVKPTHESVDTNLGVHYRGIVKGNYRSLAAISIFKDEVMGFYSTDSGGNSVIGKLGGNNPSKEHILYSEKDLKVTPDFHCDTKDDGVTLPRSVLQEPEEVMARCVRIYVETDYDLFLNKGSVDNVVTYMAGVFNQSATLYANDGISISFSEIGVWNVPSPFAGLNTSSELLSKFQSIRTTFNGDLGHLITLRQSGGLAAGISTFCLSSAARECTSGIEPTYNNVPIYSWTVSVFTHEMGHLMGSRHTHACVWNGNNTAIDSCGPTAGFPYEGSCSGASLPSNGGTIMSYCHLVSGVGINFNLGFGTQPRNVVVNQFNAAACLTDCGTACTYSLNPTSRNFTSSSGSSSFSVTTGTSCSWTAIVNAPSFSEKISLLELNDLFSPNDNRKSLNESATARIAPETVFLNSTPITINDRTSNTNPPGTASLYPSAINVSGMTGTITGVDVALNGVSHTYPDDIDVILVGPGGQRVMIMSDAGGEFDISGANLTFSQSAGSTLPDAIQISSGTYRPTNFAGTASIEPGGVDNFPSPGPGQTNYNADLSVFNGAAPNGNWQLYIVDDENLDAGNIAIGWALGITTSGGTNWINVTSGASGTGNGTVGYNVSTNSSQSQRVGTITVGGQVHTVTQSGASTNAQVTVQTNPSGRSFTVDGSTFTSAQTFTWTSGSTHSLSTTSPQGTSGTRYVWNSWSDGGAISHNVAPTSNTTYTADFTTQYQLTTSANPSNGGSVNQASGSWFNSGQSVQVIATPNAGFGFNSWTGSGSGSYTGGNNPATITMNGPVTQTANFSSVPPIARAPFDYDGDRKADISVYRPSTGVWYIRNSSNGSVSINQFGANGDLPVPADYDGDSKTDIAIYRPSNGLWYWLKSSNGAVGGNQFGTGGDIPAPGDYDGDGKADIAIFRPSTGTWWIYRSSNGGVSATQFGVSGDKPTLGDFDGDARSDLAVFRPSNATWYRLNSSTGAFIVVNFGASADKPVPADYSGDGKTDIGVFRPSTGAWYWINSATGTVNGNTFGISEDRPSPADYDGDGRADLAVFRPSQGMWYLLQTTAGLGGQVFGTSGDIPTPNSFVQ